RSSPILFGSTTDTVSAYVRRKCTQHAMGLLPSLAPKISARSSLHYRLMRRKLRRRLTALENLEVDPKIAIPPIHHVEVGQHRSTGSASPVKSPADISNSRPPTHLAQREFEFRGFAVRGAPLGLESLL